jgi:hypothetical protein
VVSVPPARWPKLNDQGTTYSFATEREMAMNKIRGALLICLSHGYTSVVIGDFGLGAGARNPPLELAELWREAFLWDPDIRGRFEWVAFVFEDQGQSTTKLILDDLAKKTSKSSSSKGKGSKSSSSKSSSSKSGSSSSSSSNDNCPTDMEIFAQVFAPSEVSRVANRPDPRYAIGMITSPQ